MSGLPNSGSSAGLKSVAYRWRNRAPICERHRGKKGDLGPVVEVKLGEDPRYVLLHGRHAHEQLAADLRVRPALAHRYGNLAFPLAEPGQQRAGVLTAGVRIRVADVGYLVNPLSPAAALGIFAFHLVAGWKTYRLSTTV
jgi:hypothetical protein